MDYTMAMNYMEEKNKLGSVPGLSSVSELLRRLGNPQDKCRCLHIAGTNGKGSVFAYVQEILLAAGYSVGRYISPTIFGYLERFQINKEDMSEEYFVSLLTRVSEQVEDMVACGIDSPTSFEIETAIAFLYFVERHVDYALIECGMGGLLDATNIIKAPEVSIIAQISRDHMQFLGETISEIASHKAGIIKAGGKCVSAPQPSEVVEILKKKCEKVGSGFTQVNEDRINITEMNLNGTSFSYGNNNYHINMLGEHQVINAATAIEATRLLPDIDNTHIKTGLENTLWKGRLTKVSEKPYFYVDGAHNEAAWITLKKAVNKYFTNSKIIYIIGVLRDKEYYKMVDILGDTMNYAIAVTPNSPRALDKEVLASLLRSHGIEACTADNSSQAIHFAEDKACENDVILVCGSLSFISDYLNYRRS